MEQLIEGKDYTIVDGVLKINEGVRHIPSKSFENDIKIKKLILPSTIISIGSYSFNWCLNIKELSLPDSVKYIMHNAFSYCNIETLLLGRNVVYIGEEAFSHNKLYYVYNNSTKLSFIGQSAFFNNDLKSFNINSYPIFVESHSIELIKINALSNKKVKFFDASSEQIIAPDCSSDTLDKYSYRDGVLKIKEGVQIIGDFTTLKECTSIEMPNSVLMILPNSFSGLNKLESVRFSSNLICLYDKAFNECSLRKNKTNLPNSTCFIDGNPFNNNEGDNQISIPMYTDINEVSLTDMSIYDRRDSCEDEANKYTYDIFALLEEEKQALKELGLLPEIINENKKINVTKSDEIKSLLKSAFIEYIMSPDYNESFDQLIILKNLETKSFDISELDEVVDYLFSRRQYKTIYMFISYGYNYMNKCMISKAIINKMYDMVDVLLLIGVDINEIGSIKLTPLSVASMFGKYDVVKYLIEKGAAINMRDANNKTAIDYARENKNKEIVDLINSYNNRAERSAEEDIIILNKLI